MKKKFSRILGVGLTLTLLASLLLMVAPVSADVDQATVDVDPDEISLASKYTINFKVNNDLTAADDTITVRFPADTDVPEGLINAANWTIAASPGWISGNWVSTAFDDTGITATGDEDDLTVIFDLVCGTDAQRIGETATVRIEFATTAGIINPTEPGEYTLEVKTSDETDYVESEIYDIDAPVVGGFVYVYNPSNILMATFGGSAALNACVAYHNDADFAIKVGPGTYTLTGDVTLSGKGLTLESSDGADDTIIDADDGTKWSIIITGEDVVIDGFTIDDADEAIIIQQDDATVKNCVITDASVAGIQIDGDGTAPDGTDATVSDNVIEDCAIGVHFNATGATDYGDVDITDNEITETSGAGGIVFENGSTDIDITGNTITGNDNSGIYFADGAVPCDDILIEGNTISENTDYGIELANANAAGAPINLAIRENNILDNEEDGILIASANSWSATLNYIMFNNIHGNTDAEIDNNSGGDVVARFNWWGTEVEADFEDELEDLVDADYEPFLVSTWETAISDSKVAVDGETSLDAKDEASVKVSGVEDTAGGFEAAIISAAKYTANPEDAIDDAVAFFDVYVLLETGFDITDVIAKLKFYDAAITETSTAHFWTGDFWALCSDLEARDGIIYVTISDDTLPALDELEETIFAVVGGGPSAALIPDISAPASGAADVSLKPVLSWTDVADATNYDVQLTGGDDAAFTFPLESGSSSANLHVVAAELDYYTTYLWRVRATTDAGISNWRTSAFTTEAAPEIPEVKVYPCPQCGLEFPDQESLADHFNATHPPAGVDVVETIEYVPVQQAIPSYLLWVIIGVGALLIIALIVLIVRTRRIA